MPTAFDPLAASYDDAFTNTATGRYLRQRVQGRLLRHLKVGDHVLELGCGTGEDARFLAQQGIHITATDVSTAMLDITRAKLQNYPTATVQQLDLNVLPAPSTLQQSVPDGFDVVFSNFGALNCLDDWRPLAQWLSHLVKPAGVVCLGIMSPFCLWEMFWHGIHGDLQIATRRLRQRSFFDAQGMVESIQVTYPTIRRIIDDFTPYFRRTHIEGLGLTLPPSDVFAIVERYRQLYHVLVGLENRLRHISQLALFADHFWIEFRHN